MQPSPTPNALVIRRANRRDFVKISRLNTLTKRPQRTDTRFLEYFVAEISADIVGCAALRCRRDLAYLYGLTVHPRWRRKGIGHSLTSHRLEAARAQEVNIAYVLAMFWNVKFFERHGFRLTGKGCAAQLQWLHLDFDDKWCRHSALLALTFEDLAASTRGPMTDLRPSGIR
jgi:N-acetylglutamate synthase-like GNAT family acetyltransferase